MSYRESVDKLINENVKIAGRHSEITNTIYGLGGFSLGISCLSMNAPTDFAYLAIVLLLLLWSSSVKKLNSAFEVLESADHKLVKPIYLFKNAYPGFLGLIFLTFVAAGDITSNGFSL